MVEMTSFENQYIDVVCIIFRGALELHIDDTALQTTHPLSKPATVVSVHGIAAAVCILPSLFQCFLVQSIDEKGLSCANRNQKAFMASSITSGVMNG